RDPLADELEKLVRIRARQVEAAGNAGSTEDEKDAAEARMLDAKIRWIERVDELTQLEPRERKKVLETEVEELASMQQTYKKQLTRSVEQARDLYQQIGIPHMVEKIQGWLDDLPPELPEG
ncbi:MAG: hypothetical protein IID42_01515, partial [Planctomycetes bacterium]|nr:hypothetical protein [Planctomycetota bacterium]